MAGDRMTAQRQDAERWRVVRELFEDCHAPGTRMSYGDVTLQKVQWFEDHTMWRVFINRQWADTLRIGQFRSARELNEYMIEVEEVEPDPYAVPSIRTASSYDPTSISKSSTSSSPER